METLVWHLHWYLRLFIRNDGCLWYEINSSFHFGSARELSVFLLFSLVPHHIHCWPLVTNTSIYYSSRVSRLKNLSLIANITLIGFCFLLVLVHIIGHGPNYLQGFPPSCVKLTNCARIAPTNPNFNSTIWPNPSQPLIIFGHDANSTADLFQGWINVQTSFPQVLFQGQPNSTYQEMGIDLLYHVRFLSFFFGFPDDLFVTFNEIYLPPPLPNSLEGTQLWIQSNARIGSKDFGVNQERVESLVSFMIGFNLTSLSGGSAFF
jgi:hypothetical protein